MLGGCDFFDDIVCSDLPSGVENVTFTLFGTEIIDAADCVGGVDFNIC